MSTSSIAATSTQNSAATLAALKTKPAGSDGDAPTVESQKSGTVNQSEKSNGDAPPQAASPTQSTGAITATTAPGTSIDKFV